jgi:hypothetical protein
LRDGEDLAAAAAEEAAADDIGETTQAIRNGIVVAGKRGVVDVGACSGALIAPNYLITSAHCMREYVGAVDSSSRLHLDVFYHDPSGTRRKIADDSESLSVWNKETYREGDAQSDIALVRRSTVWTDTTDDDYLRLSLGSCAQIDRNDLFATGYHSLDGDDDNVLRYMPVNISWCGEHHFLDREGSRSVCGGDSGGPHILNMGFYDAVVGLHSNRDPSGSGDTYCARGGVKQRAMRMNADKLGWIESKMGRECLRSSQEGHPYARCW